MKESDNATKLTLVMRKPCFGLPTCCPDCLPVYIYLRLAKVCFNVEYNLTHPDSDQLPFFEYGDNVAYNNEKGGLIQYLKDDQMVDLDYDVSLKPDWVSTERLVKTSLAEAAMLGSTDA
ncbi:hypothetical protein OROMI_008816 [Orobanche minor]